MSQPSDFGVLAGYRLRAELRVDPLSWLGPLCATAPAVHETSGVHVTAHVVLGMTDRLTRRRLLAEIADVKAWLARLENPLLAGFVDHAVDADGHPVLFTVPFGPSLADELAERGPLPLDDVMAAAMIAAGGLTALHGTNRMHHVISPRTLLRLPDNRIQLSCPAVPALAEWVALDRDGTGHEPPEVLTSGEWTPAGEVYALSSTLWTLLAGVPPTSGSQEERLAKIYGGAPLDMSRQDVPAAVLSALTTALATDPADRPAGAQELVTLMEGQRGDRAQPPGQETLSPNRPTPVVGRPLGSQYWLDEEIGKGSAGVVYRARRLSDNTVLAAKLFRKELTDNPEALKRFLREGNALLDVQHPNLVRVHDIYADGEVRALLMDLVAGVDLRRLIREQPLSRTERLRLLGQVAGALSALHHVGIVHRDVKPENVLVTRIGPEFTAILTDLGLAKTSGQPTITHQSQLLGTMSYVAPEIVAGREVTSACDVYSLSVTAYELLAGRRPFDADNPAALMHAHVAETPRRPPEMTDQEWVLLSACLEKEPTARPSAQEMSQRLTWLADQSRNPPSAASQPFDPTALEPTEPAVTASVSSPWIVVPSLPPRLVDQVVDELQPTAGATRPVRSAPVEPEAKRRRKWPLFTAVLATASLGAAIGVWLATLNSQETPGRGNTPSPPPIYPVAINTSVDAGGQVVLNWSPEVEELPGFQSYSIIRDDKLFDELDAGTARYTDLEPGPDPCYRVFALGVTSLPPNPSPPAQCPKR